MKNLFDEKVPLKITHPVGGIRITDDIFEVENGLFFFDIGWLQIGIQPMHFLEGKVTGGDGYWTIGDVTISELQPDDPYYADYADWLQVKKDKGISDELAKEILTQKIKDYDNAD